MCKKHIIKPSSLQTDTFQKENSNTGPWKDSMCKKFIKVGPSVYAVVIEIVPVSDNGGTALESYANLES